MTDSRRRIMLAALGLLAGAGAGGAIYLVFFREPTPPTPPPPLLSAAELERQVHHFCGGCHAYPPAHTFPRSAWKDEVERGYQFFNKSNLKLTPPPSEQVIKYYEERAPLELPPPKVDRAVTLHCAGRLRMGAASSSLLVQAASVAPSPPR